jgi:DNA repair protein RadC
MVERLTFVVDTQEHIRQKQAPLRPVAMFPDGVDLPLFSGTPIPVVEHPFVPEDHSFKQTMLPEMPPVDYAAVLANDRELRRRGQKRAIVPTSGDIFNTAPLTLPQEAVPDEAASRISRLEYVPLLPPPTPTVPLRDETEHLETLHPLREALAPYVDFSTLRRLAAEGGELAQSYIGTGEIPAEVQALLVALSLLLRPIHKEQVKSPQDIAAVFMLEMAHLDQEQLRVACLNTKNRLQKIHLVYQGSLNTSMIRVGEIYKEPLRLNSAAIIVAHNHPSGEPNPSPEDVLVTREIVEAGKLLDVECLDHLVIGQGKWVSMREKGLGWQ